MCNDPLPVRGGDDDIVRFRDAAIATGPVVTTLIDVLGVFVYLSVAKLLLQL